MRIYSKEEIEKVIDVPFFLKEIEKGLVLHSKKQVTIASPSFLAFKEPPGEVHIKSGCIFGEEYYVVKIASGFYRNPEISLPVSDGLMLLFSQKTGVLQAILLDQGRLTDLRTGIAGAIAAKYLAPPKVHKIGIVGTGTQAREQLYALQFVTPCRDVLVWGRDKEKAKALTRDSRFASFAISVVETIEELADQANLIVTTTNSTAPLLFGHQIQEGTHITAVGADGGGKQELDASIFEKADLIAVDSLPGCLAHGDLSHVKNPDHKKIAELGELIAHPRPRLPKEITIADLTGIAIEDLQIAKAVWSRLIATSMSDS